jgi:hypothetical protein
MTGQVERLGSQRFEHGDQVTITCAALGDDRESAFLPLPEHRQDARPFAWPGRTRRSDWRRAQVSWLMGAGPAPAWLGAGAGAARLHVMGFVLGREVESMTFTDDGIEYLPGGVAHAVDTASPVNARGGVTGFAVCGAAVRVWPEQPFDLQAGNVHGECAQILGHAD